MELIEAANHSVGGWAESVGEMTGEASVPCSWFHELLARTLQQRVGSESHKQARELLEELPPSRWQQPQLIDLWKQLVGLLEQDRLQQPLLVANKLTGHPKTSTRLGQHLLETLSAENGVYLMLATIEPVCRDPVVVKQLLGTQNKFVHRLILDHGSPETIRLAFPAYARQHPRLALQFLADRTDKRKMLSAQQINPLLSHPEHTIRKQAFRVLNDIEDPRDS